LHNFHPDSLLNNRFNPLPPRVCHLLATAKASPLLSGESVLICSVVAGYWFYQIYDALKRKFSA
ncbi:MAG: hypothetical protein LUP96_07105, partial [Methylococcaceae bacterium]|nr:hypothetical protein [Methylococcaceae bacterium]